MNVRYWYWNLGRVESAAGEIGPFTKAWVWWWCRNGTARIG